MRLPIALLSTFLISACAQPATRADAPGTAAGASASQACASEPPATGSRVPKARRGCKSTGGAASQ